MSHFDLAVCVDDLGREIKDGLQLARRMGFAAVDIRAVNGPVSPSEMTETARRHFRRHLADLGLRPASLRGPTAGPGYGDSAGGDRRIELARRVIDLASGLGVPVVTTSLGSVAAESIGERNRLTEAMQILANAADQRGIILAVDTGGVPTADLRALLAEINCPSLAACCDSGAMLMQGEDPSNIGALMAGRVLAVRARDAMRGHKGAPGYEVAQGAGQLDVQRFLAGLAEAGYAGDLTLTRSSSGTAVDDLRRAKETFERALKS